MGSRERLLTPQSDVSMHLVALALGAPPDAVMTTALVQGTSEEDGCVA